MTAAPHTSIRSSPRSPTPGLTRMSTSYGASCRCWERPARRRCSRRPSPSKPPGGSDPRPEPPAHAGRGVLSCGEVDHPAVTPRAHLSTHGGQPVGGSPPSCTWSDVQEAMQTLVGTTPRGGAHRETDTHRSTHRHTDARTSRDVFQLTGKPPTTVAKGLPPLPPQPPIVWTVLVALRQWNRVKDSLAAHPDDTLVIEGYPCVDHDRRSADGGVRVSLSPCSGHGERLKKLRRHRKVRKQPPER